MSEKLRGKTYRHLPAFILLALADGPLHGGAINSTLAQNMPAYRADTAAVYRALQQMEKDGEVTAEWDTSIPGPARKIYHLTATGWTRLDFWRADVELRLKNLHYFLDNHTRIMANKNHA